MDDAQARQLDRIKAEIAYSFDEELEMQLEEDRLDELVAEGMSAPAPETIPRKLYFSELFRLQHELVRLQDWVPYKKLKILVIFEGRDSAGKDVRAKLSQIGSLKLGGASMRKLVWFGSVSLLLLGLDGANAADLGVAAPVVAPPLAKQSLSDTFTTEFGEDFAAQSSPSFDQWGNTDWYLKFDLAHAFDNGVVVNAFIQPQQNFHPGADDEWRYYTEGDMGYKAKLSDSFTLTPKAGIGYVWGDTGIEGGKEALYYALYLAGDMKLASNWTWNMFSLRYRNAFNFEWVTPKVSSGLTYKISDTSSLYGNFGYSWKNGDPDKYSLAVGAKIALP